MTNVPESIWTPLTKSPSIAPPHAPKEPPTVWYWLPGWSFKAEVFEPLYSCLPGQHYGLSFSALFQTLSHQSNPSGHRAETSSESYLAQPDFEKAVSLIIKQAKPGAHWVGWSLGGALAWQAVAKEPQLKALSVTALATGRRFLAQQPDSSIGMQPEVFQAFRQQFEKAPAKTLKRFRMLCAQGSSNPRALASELGTVQLAADQPEQVTELATALHWLENYRLNDLGNVQTAAAALYATQDALMPGGLPTGSSIPPVNGSHGFLFEADGQALLLQYLNLLPAHIANDQEATPC